MNLSAKRLAATLLMPDALCDDAHAWECYGRTIEGLCYLRMTNPEEYERIMQERRDACAAQERQHWLALPWHQRAYITLGKHLRSSTRGVRERLIAWLSWDDIYEGDYDA